MSTQFRVEFDGIATGDAERLLAQAQYQWEESGGRHCIVVEADSAEDAVTRVAETLHEYGAFANFSATPA